MRKICFGIVGIVLGFGFTILPVLDALTLQAQYALGILLCAIVWWIGKVMADYVTALFMAVSMIIIAKVPTEVMFSAFSNSSWWLLFTAFGLSLGVIKCGLMDRIALNVLRVFPGTFGGQVLALISVGFITAPFIPSMSAKAAMIAPLSKSINDAMGYEGQVKQANGLFLAMLTGIRNPGPLFISSTVLGYAFLGLYPAEISSQFGMARWIVCALPAFIVISVLNFLALVLLYRPKKEQQKEKAVINAQLRSLGPMSGKEKYMLVLILVTMLLWVTESNHGIPPHVIAIAALALTLVGNVYDKKAFCAELNWDSIIYLGIVLGIASVLSSLGINTWIVECCSPVFEKLMANPFLLVVSVGLITVLMRFIIVSELAFVNIFMVFMIPIAMSHGINPWVVGFSVFVLVHPWFFIYQNPVYMAAYCATDGKMINQTEAAKYCTVYVFICLTALVISVPYWVNTGVFYLTV